MTQSTSRIADHPVDPQFLNRWSPRAFTGEEISAATVHIFLEAARWAPSSYNSQPWRFVYARKGTEHWETLLGLLNEANQSWAKNASVLMISISKDTFLPPGAKEEVPAVAHTFDAGSAWAYLALQASLSGWHAHAMIGFDKQKSRDVLGVPAGYTVEAAIAVGKIADKEILPEVLRARENPSPRLPVTAFAFEGASFKA